MRRLLATVLLGTTLLAGAGCAGERERTGSPVPGPSGSAPATASGSSSPLPTSPGVVPSSPGATSPGGVLNGPPVTAPAAGNAKEVCAVATKVNAESAQKYVTELGRYLQATGQNDTKTAEDAKRTIMATLDTWATTMRQQSAKATDPQLKQALAEIATEITRLSETGEAVGPDGFDELQQRLNQLCGA